MPSCSCHWRWYGSPICWTGTWRVATASYSVPCSASRLPGCTGWGQKAGGQGGLAEATLVSRAGCYNPARKRPVRRRASHGPERHPSHSHRRQRRTGRAHMPCPGRRGRKRRRPVQQRPGAGRERRVRGRREGRGGRAGAVRRYGPGGRIGRGGDHPCGDSAGSISWSTTRATTSGSPSATWTP